MGYYPITYNNDADDYHPAWSPDSTKIAVALGGDIYVINADGSNQKRLTYNSDADDNHPAWSPDGTKVAFDRYQHDNTEIYIMNADGSNQKRIADSSKETDLTIGELVITDNPAWYGPPAWSPDGTRIAFISRRDRSGSYIYIMNADGSNQKSIPDSSDWGLPSHYPYLHFRHTPEWSPDSTRIAYGRRNIYIISAYGINYINLNIDDVDPPRWSPDSTRIAFTFYKDHPDPTQPTSNRDIYVMNADGSNRMRLTGSDSAPFIVLGIVLGLVAIPMILVVWWLVRRHRRSLSIARGSPKNP